MAYDEIDLAEYVDTGRSESIPRRQGFARIDDRTIAGIRYRAGRRSRRYGDLETFGCPAVAFVSGAR